MQEKHITLFLSAHGSTEGDTRLDFENVKVKIFSAASSCEPSYMSYSQDLGSMDNNIMKDVARNYKEKYDIPRNKLFTKDEFKNHPEYMIDLPEIMSFPRYQIISPDRLLTYAQEVFIEQHEKYYIELKDNDNYNIYTPISGRIFDFFSAECENCKDKELCRRGRCLPKRNIDTLKVPHYGMFVMSSSDANDRDYTLMMNINNEEMEGINNEIITQANINNNPRTQLYWRNKLSQYLDLSIETDSNILDMWDEFIETKRTTLTEIIIMFTKMGYKEIYIIDPACRDIVDPEIDKTIVRAAESIERSMDNLGLSRRSSPRSTPISSPISSPIPFFNMPLNEEENDDGTPLIKENKRTMVKPLSKVKKICPGANCTISGGKYKRKTKSKRKDKKSKKTKKNKNK